MFSTRALALIHKFFEFYLEHQPELDAYVGRCDAQMARRRPAAPRGPELAELRRRLAAKQGAGA